MDAAPASPMVLPGSPSNQTEPTKKTSARKPSSARDRSGVQARAELAATVEDHFGIAPIPERFHPKGENSIERREDARQHDGDSPALSPTLK
jgi:hypothetical protein